MISLFRPASKSGPKTGPRQSRCQVITLFATLACLAALAEPATDWPPLTSQTRPWTWWWWHGSAVDKTNLARELQEFHDAGLGGVQITTIYGVQGAEACDIPYLTPQWLAMMGCTVDEARRLGMGVDMSLGSGWCFGGPTVNDEDANASVVLKTFKVSANEKLPENLTAIPHRRSSHFRRMGNVLI